MFPQLQITTGHSAEFAYKMATKANQWVCLWRKTTPLTKKVSVRPVLQKPGGGDVKPSRSSGNGSVTTVSAKNQKKKKNAAVFVGRCAGTHPTLVVWKSTAN